MATDKKRAPQAIDPDYAGRQDYQGNHDVFEMPEEHKPSGPTVPKVPLNKIALAVILACVIVLLILTTVSLMQHNPLR